MSKEIADNALLFEQIKRTDDQGFEYWSARELSKVFGYSEYRHFLPVVNKAKENCQNKGDETADHFEDNLEMVGIGSGAFRKLDSIKLSRYACSVLSSYVDESKPNRGEALRFFTTLPMFSDFSPELHNQLTVSDETSNFLLYTTPDGKVRVEAYLANETVWLSQDQMALMFDVQSPAISKHLKNIFQNKELEMPSVVSILETTAPDGKKYKMMYYNLDAIISVGYRINSSRATQFRIWATQVIREYIIKGFAMDDDRLKNGQYFGKDYFEELLERIRSIRSGERRIYQKITDIFAECSIDYNKNSQQAREFYAEVQNKFHYAITQQTAPEIIFRNANADKEFMGLKTWKNSPKGRILKSDVIVAKNYLNVDEIQYLERTISSFFDYIELLIKRRESLTMNDFAQSVIKFLEFNEYKILTDRGSVSREQAERKAFAQYEVFNKRQVIESDFDRIIFQLKQTEQ